MASVVLILCGALFGVIAAGLMLRIRHKVHTKGHYTCPPYYNCSLLMNSKYANFFGAPLEFIALMYYGVFLLFIFAQKSFPMLQNSLSTFIIMLLALFALLFSFYLLGVQAITLRKFCLWCLGMFVANILILFGVYYSVDNFLEVLRSQKYLLQVLHLLGFAFGLGAATLTDLFFFRFLKDFRISKWEARILHSFSHLIWAGLILLIVSGIGLFLINMDILLHSSKFLTKMIIVGVIVINGILLNLYISPRMIHISFGEKHKHKGGELHMLRKAAFAAGAVSFVSWYSAFFLGAARSIPLSLSQALLIYLVLVLFGVVSSQFLERFYDLKSK